VVYVAASTGVPEGSEGVASAMAMTAQQLGGSVGLALLVALLTERVTALGGTAVGSSIRPAGAATSALHVNFAAQGIVALAGAATAMFVLGRGRRGRTRVAEREARDGGTTDTKGV